MARRSICGLAALTALFLAGKAEAGCGEAAGPAEAAVREVVASIEGNEETTCVFYGDYTGDGRNDALVFVYYSGLEGGNMIMLDVSKLRFHRGRFEPDGKVNALYGESPRNVEFRIGSITLTTTTLGPDEPRCCPTVPQRWMIEAR